MFYSANFLRTSSSGHSISDNAEKTVPKSQGGRGNQDIQEFLQQRPGIRNIKRLLLIKENQTSQVKEFSSSLCMGRCKSLGSLKSFF